MGVVGELRNKTKLQHSSVEAELWLSLAIVIFNMGEIVQKCLVMMEVLLRRLMVFLIRYIKKITNN